MERNGICIRTSGKIEKVVITDYSDMGQYVGGYLEALPIDEQKHGLSVFINEEGLINELPINMPASLWLQKNGMWATRGYPIHGDVLVMGATDAEGETPSVPAGTEYTIPHMLQEPKFEVQPLNEDMGHFGHMGMVED